MTSFCIQENHELASVSKCGCNTKENHLTRLAYLKETILYELLKRCDEEIRPARREKIKERKEKKTNISVFFFLDMPCDLLSQTKLCKCKKEKKSNTAKYPTRETQRKRHEEKSNPVFLHPNHMNKQLRHPVTVPSLLPFPLPSPSPFLLPSPLPSSTPFTQPSIHSSSAGIHSPSHCQNGSSASS